MSSARRLLKTLLLTLAVGAVAGCFRSDKPLIDKAQAAFPFEELTVKNDEGETFILRKESEGEGYAYFGFEESGKRGENPVLLHQVEDHLYVLQEAAQGGNTTYLLARREGNKFTVSSICPAIDEAMLIRL